MKRERARADAGESADARGSADDRGALSGFVDALIAYAIDPARWDELLGQLDRLSDRLERWDPGELVSELSRAESLSWHISHDGADPYRSGFAYVLMDDQGRATAKSDNLATLGDYLVLADDGTVQFTDQASSASMEAARLNLHSSERGHSLVSLSHPGRGRHRFGFLIAREEFPPSLARTAGSASAALFIAQDDATERLQHVVQASFGLTSAESELTIRLAQGLTLKESARDLEISIHTARNHLQSVFDKSGINRQSDLVLVVTQLSVILAGTGEEPTRPREPRRSPSRHFLILPDGRRLAYRTYGSPHGAPCLYLHETLGCSSLPPGTDELAAEQGLFLIAPERPGFGFSDIDAAYSFDSVSADLAHLLDHLHIEQCTPLGYLSGGAYALWFANRHPDRIPRLVLVAARPPMPMQGRFRHLMPLYNKMIAQPWLMTSFFNILRNRSSAHTNARLIQSVYGAVPHDRAYLAGNPDMFEHMVAYTSESLTVTAAGITSELKCFANAGEPELSRLTMPISAWHGEEDKLSSPELLERCLSGCQVRWRRLPGAGSLILLEHWRDIVADLAG
jgi:pimeloyl-ACP methyl ester carboxylesterase/DNA-binding CsgD family transcriptional regulator